MNKKAFTLIEVIIAMTFVALVLTAITGLMIATLHANIRNTHVLQATALAQEGIENLRFMRDSNQIQNLSWDGGELFWGADLSVNEGTKILYLDQVACAPPASVCWTFSSTPEEIVLSGTSFTRTITLNPIDNEEMSGDILEVVVTVTWEERGELETVSLSTYLSNWQQ